MILALVAGAFRFLLYLYPPFSTPPKNNNAHSEVDFPNMSVRDLFEQSSLVVIGTLSGEPATFRIRVAGGGAERIYTDYCFSVERVLRGGSETPTVTVRLPGGTIGKETESWDYVPVLQPDKTYLLFLYQPGDGGGFNTRGDYYYVTTSHLGAFEQRADGSFVSGTRVLRESQLAEPEGLGPPVNHRETYLNNLKGTLENGVITQEGYDDAVAAMEQYATIVEE